MTAPMPETMSPREKVARIIDPAAFLFTADELMKGDPSQFNALAKADQIFAALVSSGDHAELALNAKAAQTWALGIYENRDQAARRSEFIDGDLPATVLALIAEVAALRGENEHVKKLRHQAIDRSRLWEIDAIKWETRATEAERKLAEANRLLEQIANDPTWDGPSSARLYFLSKGAERG